MLTQDEYLDKLAREVAEGLEVVGATIAIVHGRADINDVSSISSGKVVQDIRSAMDALRLLEAKANMLHGHLHAIGR